MRFKVFENRICVIEILWSNRKQMPKLKEDKKMSWGISGFHYSKNIICCKIVRQQAYSLFGNNVDSMSGVSNIIRQTKSSVMA